jgi:hypothetical protein
MNYDIDICDYDFNQDLTPFVNVLSNYGKANYRIHEVRVSDDIFSYWAASNDPLFLNAFDPVAQVADLEKGWLGTLYGFKITGTAYVPKHIIPHLLPLPEGKFLVFSEPYSSAPDLMGLAQQVTSP